MPSAITGRVHVRVVFNDFDKIGRKLHARAEELVAKAAHDIEAHTKEGILAHGLVDTGALLNSVQARQLGPMRWVVEVGQSYGIYHEFGTRYLPARPFLHPAVEQVAPAFLAGLRQLVDR